MKDRLMAAMSMAPLSLVATMPAMAQETTVLDRMVISAGEEKVAVETPQSVSVVDQEDLAAEQPTTIGDALTDLPGVKAIGSDRVLGESFNIRGFGTLGASDENRMIVQVDGATKFHEQYRMGSFFSDPELYKRVEVLRGPASSTLFGAGALAGVITLTTKDAGDFLRDDESWTIRQKFEGSTNGLGGLSSTVAAIRPSESFELIGAFNYRGARKFEDGKGDKISGSDFDAPSGLVKGTFTFGADMDHKLRASWQHWTTEETDSDYSQTGTITDFGTVDRKVTDKTAVIGYQHDPVDNDLVDIDLVLSYTDTEVEQYNASLQGFSPLFDDTTYAYEIWQGKLENTFTVEGDSFANYLTVGTQIAHQTRTADKTPTVADPSSGIGFHPGGESMQVGGYIQNELILWDRLTLIPGIRVDWQELEPGDAVANGEKVDDVGLAPKLAAHWQATDIVGLFGSVAYTERLPVIDELYDADSGNLNLDPEKSLSYEAGVALSWRNVATDNDAFSAKLTGFWYDVEDLIERESTTTSYYNVGKAEIRGIEFEAAYESTYAFGRAAYTLIRGEDTESNDALNSIPADEIVLTLGGRVPAHDLEFGWRIVHAFDQDEVSGTTTPTSDYTVHDIFASWKPSGGLLDRTEFRFGIENVFDRYYQEHLAGDPAKGRTFKLTIARQF